MAEGILGGTKVVDLSSGIAGSVATMLLAEVGADVIRVEDPASDSERGRAGFRTWNRSKRSIVADVGSDHGLARLKELLAAADVFVHELTPTRTRELGLDDVALGELNPGLIVASVLSWPANHADADLRVDEALAMARLGVCDEQLPRAREEGPVYLRYPLASWSAVYLAATGIVARLISRGRTGVAGPAHTSLAQAGLATMGMFWYRGDYLPPGIARGMSKGGGGPANWVYECRDGLWMHVMPDPLRSPRVREFVESFDGGRDEALVACFRTDTRQAWLEHLWASDVPVQACAEFGEIFSDEQAHVNGYLVDLDDPVDGPITVAGLPLTLQPAQQIKNPAPAPGVNIDVHDVLSSWQPPSLPPKGGGQGRWPLEGVKVLDLGNYLAGPYGPQMLADLGADVVKLEATTGDAMRGVGSFFGCQRGKRGLALDLKSPVARPALEAAIRWADVVHHNLRMPAARRLGIDPESVRKINPDVIFCHTSSYGPIGPRADWPGYDQLFQAQCGWETLGAGEGNPPMWHRFGFMDHQCAMSSALATVLALYHRDRTGRGQDVAASLLGAGVLTVSEIFERADGTLAPFERLGADQLTLSEGRRIVRLSDGWILLAADEPSHLAALRTVPLEGRKVDDALVDLAAAGVPAERVREDNRDAFFANPDNRAAGLVAEYDHVAWGHVVHPGALWWFRDLEVRLDLAVPELGEHTVECLEEFGLDESAIEALLDTGTAKQYGR